jgi:hypothetical protein
MKVDPEKVESRGLSFSVTPDLKNGSFFLKAKDRSLRQLLHLFSL